MFDVRKNVLKTLKRLSTAKWNPMYTNEITLSTGVMVEPRLSLQWFVDMKGLRQTNPLPQVNLSNVLGEKYI